MPTSSRWPPGAARSTAYQMEKRYLRRDGELIWVMLSCQLVRDERGRPAHFISQIQDITAPRKAQAALARGEARFQAIFDHVPAALVLRDVDGRYEHVNAYVARGAGSQPRGMKLDRAHRGRPVTRPEAAAEIRDAGRAACSRAGRPMLRGATPSRNADGTIARLPRRQVPRPSMPTERSPRWGPSRSRSPSASRSSASSCAQARGAG